MGTHKFWVMVIVVLALNGERILNIRAHAIAVTNCISVSKIFVECSNIQTISWSHP
jgi:hypothetical protein